MKKSFTITSLCSLFVMILLFSCAPLKEMPEVADQFFKSASGKDFDKAYTLVSLGFQGNTSKEQMAEFLKSNGLLNFKEAVWNSKEYKNQKGELNGVLKTDKGGTIPIKLTFVKENDKWRIHLIEIDKPGINPVTNEKTVPTEHVLVAMAVAAVHDLGMAINSKDFTAFYNNSAAVWQKQTTKEKLLEAFQDFVVKKVDITPAKDLIPIFKEKAEIDANDILVVKGYFPTIPAQIHFVLRYAFEQNQWKLYGINIKTVEPNEEPA